MSTSSSPNPRRILQRNRHRKRLGGVCAGLADYLGMNLTLIRFLCFLLIPLTGSLVFWAYLALWFLLPIPADAPIPKVSWELARELRRMGDKVKKLHRRHDPALADLAQQALDALKLIAARFEAPDAKAGADLREAALVRFPKLLERIADTPADLFAHGSGAAQTSAQTLLNQLIELHEQFQKAAKEQVEQEFQASYQPRADETPELAAWREKLGPMRDRLRERAGPETLSVLGSIEEKLAFLLARLAQGGELFDLRPFEVRKIAFDYLPDALNQYLALPPSLARTQRLHSGKTAEESLNEQLGLLDNTLRDLSKSLFEQDAGGLLVHGRFLREKFAEQAFRLPD